MSKLKNIFISVIVSMVALTSLSAKIINADVLDSVSLNEESSLISESTLLTNETLEITESEITESEPIIPEATKSTKADFGFNAQTGELFSYTGETKDVIIPETIHGVAVKKIGANVFNGLMLTSVIIPDTVEEICEGAFSGNLLSDVKLPSSLVHLGEAAFMGNQLTSIEIPNSLNSISCYVFQSNRLTNLVIPNSIKTIGNGSFADNSLSSIFIPDSVLLIEAGAFFQNNLTSVVIPDSVKTIEDFAFGNNQINKLTLSTNLMTIGKNAFTENLLSQITLPKSINRLVEFVRDDVFYNITGKTYTDNPNIPQIMSHSFDEGVEYENFRNLDTAQKLEMVYTTSSIYVRPVKGSATSLGILPKDTKVTGYREGVWIRFTYQGKTAYIAASLTSTKVPTINTTLETLYTTSSIYVRPMKGSTTSLGILPKNTKVIGYREGAWIRFAYQGKTAYIAARLTSKYDLSKITSIMGKSIATESQMKSFLQKNNNSAEDYMDLPKLFLEEGAIEGVRGDIAFAQSILETGYFRFGGDVQAEQNNFSGIGATGNGNPGNSFSSKRIGVRAQIQHLLAYASNNTPKSTIVDPRFSYVSRAGAPYVEWLGIQENPHGIGWAYSADYGFKIMEILDQILASK